MLESFWTTIAQVSATFAGLVFVGFSIYLSNIREATDEIRRHLPESKEVLGSLMYLVVYSNLLFYWLPLLLSLTSLAERTYLVQMTAAKVVFISFLLFLLLFGVLLFKICRQQWQSIRQAVRYLSLVKRNGLLPTSSIASAQWSEKNKTTLPGLAASATDVVANARRPMAYGLQPSSYTWVILFPLSLELGKMVTGMGNS
jgi:hypothetical protein